MYLEEHYATDILAGAVRRDSGVPGESAAYPTTPDRIGAKVAGCKPIVVLFPGLPFAVELFDPLIEMGKFIHRLA